MGWFSPIKGHYPSLGQIDKTLPVASGNTGIERGTIIEMTSDNVSTIGAFKVAANATNEGLLYIALQDYDDAQAGMAGTTGFDESFGPHTEGQITVPGVTAGVPTITGLSLSMDGEYETDMFDDTLTGASVGTALTVKLGRLSKAAAATEGTPADPVVAYLTAPVDSRWINNLNVKPKNATKHTATRQGGTKTVIRFRTK